MDKVQMIHGVIVQQLKQFPAERGRVMHMLRVDSFLFDRFGEIYFSEVLPGVVKAWKRHKEMTQFFAVPVGDIRLVIYDERENSLTKGKQMILEIGRENYQLVKIPPRLWYGFKCTSPRPALIANCADMPHDPEESETLDPNDLKIPYEW